MTAFTNFLLLAVDTINAYLSDYILIALCAFIFLGGVKRIASVAEKVVPFMAILYIGICFVFLCFNIMSCFSLVCSATENA